MEQVEKGTAIRRLQHLAGHLRTQDNEVSHLTQQNCDASANPTGPLDEERENPSFDVRALTYILDGSPEATQLKELMASFIENDPILKDDDRYDLTRPQARERTLIKVKHVLDKWSEGPAKKAIPRSGKLAKKDKQNEAKKAGDAFWNVMSLYDPSWATRIGVHIGLFWSAIQGQGTKEQQRKYASDVQKGKILGCFAMTELGHGSYIRGFETTATYDKSTQEFVINSPTDTSTKWWIGMAGQTATHSVAFARLIIDGKDYGVHSFVVPIRSIEDGNVLPGIKAGDCGAKMGRNGLDNGWIQYHNVRVPRENMLMKWAKVSPEGEYSKPPKAQLSYGALIGGRVGMIQDSSDYAKKALTIAVRYSAVRRQFHTNKKEEEKIIDYQTHQMKLMPLLATCFAYHFTSDQIKKKFEALTEELSKGDISNLVGVHATSAGLKAFSTWWCNEALEQCRQSLGGHGYSSYAGLSSLLADFAVMCTWEGDNTVLAQQTSKYLVKTLRNAVQGKPVHGFERYLADARGILDEKQWKAQSDEDLLNPEYQLQVLRFLSVYVLARVSKRMQAEAAKGKNKHEIWNECMVDLVMASKVHCEYYVLSCFVDAIKELPADHSSNGVKKVLKNLCDLHAMVVMERYFGFLLESGYLNSKQSEMIRKQIRVLCLTIRKDAVLIVDSFNFPDFVINSPLGRYDGQVYKHYLETVQKAPGAIGRPPYWESVIKPMTHRSD